MKVFKILLIVFASTAFCSPRLLAQKKITDSSTQAIENLLFRQKEEQLVDSLAIVQLQNELVKTVATDSKQRKELESRFYEMLERDSTRKAGLLKKINELKKQAAAYPVILEADTLFYIFTGIGAFTAAERAHAISERVKNLYGDGLFENDSLKIIQDENNYDIVFNNDNVIMSVTSLDALWFNLPQDSLANSYIAKIKTGISTARRANSFTAGLTRLGYIALIILGIGLIVIVINALFKRSAKAILHKKDRYFSGIAIKNINILPAKQHYQIALQTNNILRIIVIVLSIYLSLPPLFSLFPQTKFFANVLWKWITTPAKAVFNGLLAFLPNLFAILIICIAFRYLVKLVRYFAIEVESGAIHLHGFHAEWAKPTFNIIRFITYAFMFIIIYPDLPGSNSIAFQGVSVFLGLLISLGSSSAISNIVSGLVITYMRPFKIGDRVKIGEITGDVIEKTMLVTRIRTSKSEDVTVPNSTVLSSHTINYSANTQARGLIVHTTVTIGYNVPWKEIHQALIDAALKSVHILQQPLPFVLQTSLDDYYVSYQINAYTREANKQSDIYSSLHQNIQDVCNERGIEIMSPQYNAVRDGSTTTIPKTYVPPDYQPPSFNINLNGGGAEKKG